MAGLLDDLWSLFDLGERYWSFDPDYDTDTGKRNVVRLTLDKRFRAHVYDIYDCREEILAQWDEDDETTQKPVEYFVELPAQQHWMKRHMANGGEAGDVKDFSRNFKFGIESNPDEIGDVSTESNCCIFAGRIHDQSMTIGWKLRPMAGYPVEITYDMVKGSGTLKIFLNDEHTTSVGGRDTSELD